MTGRFPVLRKQLKKGNLPRFPAEKISSAQHVDASTETRRLLRHRLEALHANLNSFRRARDGCFNGTQIGDEKPFVHIMSMRNGVARPRVFSAHFACFRHETLLMKPSEPKV
jgi:hypothetical protein